MSHRGQRREQVKSVNELIDNKLTNQLRIFFGIFLLMTVLVVFHLIADRINPLWALVGAVFGVVIGRILGRTKALNWNESTQTVVATSSLIGTIILLAYIVFAVFKSKLIDNWISDPEIVSVVGLALTAGVMIGRMSYILRGLQDLLRLVRQPRAARIEPSSPRDSR